MTVECSEQGDGGNLSGNIRDIHRNPIEGAHVTVAFHGTFCDAHSNEEGFYQVTGIPLCRCLKCVSVTKEGYIPVTVWMHIDEDSWYDFVLLEEKPTITDTD